jgi:hypothetical protein
LDDSVQLDLDIGSGMHVRALAIKDAAMLVDATSRESAPALWVLGRPSRIRCATRRRRCWHGTLLLAASFRLASCAPSSSSARSG